jgi:exopolysaccharide/PEP-CTERM locus tyrosine autokinase
MSKIEKALRKARAGGALRIVSNQPQPSADGAQALAVVPNPAATDEIEGRAGAAMAIARMREPAALERTALQAGRIIYPEMPDNAVMQAFRQIRTHIIQKTQGRNAIIMVTSVKGGGGSSFVALNLGVAFAFDAGKTALLVDCNFRRPSLNRLFPSGACQGLADYLEQPRMDVAQILYPVGIDRLRVIPAGGKREIPAEYFTSAKMRRFLDDIKQRYRERYIVLDAPPMTESADTQILSELCDLVLLVAPYGRVTAPQLDACVQGIDPNKFIGVVFNGEPHPPLIRWAELLKGPFLKFGKSARLRYGRLVFFLRELRDKKK